MLIHITKFLYKYFLKPWFFRFDPEFVHNRMMFNGKLGAKLGLLKIASFFFDKNYPQLSQEISGSKFKNVVGLSAGFDYNADLSGFLGDIGFGFESVGTITYSPYQGNPYPRLARLPKSQSLLVNKGFKNLGLKRILEDIKFSDNLAVGISIGATNSPDIATSDKQIADIVKSFQYLLSHPKALRFAYYEVNISCPNVAGAGNLANSKDLTKLLQDINALAPQRPLFVKFPIGIAFAEADKLITIMIKHKVSAVIIGNLLKDRTHKVFDQQEIARMEKLKGNFSGKPTWDLSNQLIEHVYQKFGRKIKIIGVGGIFSAEDAYTKIKLGASMIQLITGMIYQGPQLAAEINHGVSKLLDRDGYRTIHEAIGTSVKPISAHY